MEATKLTKTKIDHMTFAGKTDKTHDIRWDNEISGFGVRVHPTGRKVFILRYRYAGRRKLLTLGKYGDITLDQARTLARSELGKVAGHQDPLALRKQAKVKAKRDQIAGTTLRQAYEEYRQTHNLAERTLNEYDRIMRTDLSDWLDKPLTQISGEMVLARHRSLKPAYGNLCMRLLRAVFNYAMGRYVLADGEYLLARNPVGILSQTKSWAKVSPRTKHLTASQLPAWFDAMEQEQNQAMRDYLLFVLLTGIRRQNAASLRWDQVDFDEHTFTVKPKGHDCVELPIPDHLYSVLQARRADASSPFVFPGGGESGHLEDPKKALERMAKHSGIKLTIHDLRRSYARFGADIHLSTDIIKQLMVHSLKGDVTFNHYIQYSVERLKEPSQAIEDHILSKIFQAQNVVPFCSVRKAQ